MDYINNLMETETQSTGGTEEMARIVRFHQLGGPGVLKTEEVPTQEPKKGEVGLRVRAIGLNRSESMFMHGYAPSALASDPLSRRAGAQREIAS